jgi:hypothetical protein
VMDLPRLAPIRKPNNGQSEPIPSAVFGHLGEYGQSGRTLAGSRKTPGEQAARIA